MKGEKIMGILGARALDINMTDEQLCEVLGYLATPGRIGYIEAQIPEDRAWEFESEYPGQAYYPIVQGYTTGGNIMKQGCQFRIYFNNIENYPPVLGDKFGQGTGAYVARINKGAFIEKIILKYGFQFGHIQNPDLIHQKVIYYFPQYDEAFRRGYER